MLANKIIQRALTELRSKEVFTTQAFSCLNIFYFAYFYFFWIFDIGNV